MEIKISITLNANIADEGANINEICRAVKEAQQRISPEVARHIIERIQDNIIERLTTLSGRRKKKGLGRHPVKGNEGQLCRYRTFTRQGYRGEERKVNTDIGEVKFRVGYVKCGGCEKKIAPVLSVLEMKPVQRHSLSLEQVVLEAVSETSYRRGDVDIKARGCAPTSISSAHRWAVSRNIPEKPEGKVQTIMADGTGFKKWPKEKGNVRIVLGFNEEGEIQRLGSYAGKSWEEIDKEVRKKLKGTGSQLKLFTSDGERGLDEFLSDCVEKKQRCTWHLPRDLGYNLWKDGMDKDKRKEQQKRLSKLLAIEVPGKQIENVSSEDKEKIKKEIMERQRSLSRMAFKFHCKGYHKAARYLENAFEHLHLWLETGIVAPKTVSILENIMREVGRRIKKIGWNWSDRGAEQITRMVLLRHYDKSSWIQLWEKLLNLKNRCAISFVEVRSFMVSAT